MKCSRATGQAVILGNTGTELRVHIESKAGDIDNRPDHSAEQYCPASHGFRNQKTSCNERQSSDYPVEIPVHLHFLQNLVVETDVDVGSKDAES